MSVKEAASFTLNPLKIPKTSGHQHQTGCKFDERNVQMLGWTPLTHYPVPRPSTMFPTETGYY